MAVWKIYGWKSVRKLHGCGFVWFL